MLALFREAAVEVMNMRWLSGGQCWAFQRKASNRDRLFAICSSLNEVVASLRWDSSGVCTAAWLIHRQNNTLIC